MPAPPRRASPHAQAGECQSRRRNKTWIPLLPTAVFCWSGVLVLKLTASGTGKGAYRKRLLYVEYSLTLSHNNAWRTIGARHAYEIRVEAVADSL